MIATIFAFAFGFGFSLAANFIFHWYKEKNFALKTLKPIIFFGLLAAFLLTMGGNLHTLYWYLTHNFSFEGYWYPDATRFIEIKFGAQDNTIHEFPSYSFVVSDLHGHVNNIPFVLFFLALLFAFLLRKEENQGQYLVLMSLVLAIMIMTNTWDFPIYFLLLSLTVLLSFSTHFSFGLKDFWQKIAPLLKNVLSFLFLSFLLAVILAIPFLSNFTYSGEGIGLTKAQTPLLQLVVLWGYQSFLAISFLVFLVLRMFFYKVEYRPSISEIFIFILCLTAFILIFIPEVIYLKDIYGIEYHRSNTMFKLVYQAFILLAISIPFIIFLFWKEIKKKWLKIPLFSFSAVFLTFVLIYPYFAIKSYYGSLNNFKNYKGLYGLDFLANRYPDDYSGILWLKQNIEDETGVLEAAGDSFTDFNRVSAITGLPTIQGWLVHEWLWRGSFDEVGQRAGIVQTIYETNLAEEALELLSQYKMEYVFLGEKEREKYLVSEEKFSQIGKVVFRSGSTKIYKINL